MSKLPPFRSVLGTLLSLSLLVGVLSQAPWGAIGAAVGWGPATHDEQAAGARRGSASTDRSSTSTETTRRVAPSTLHVAPWGEDFRVVGVDLDDHGALVPPDDVSTLGWWNGGALPGDGTGTVVLVVHRDSATRGRGPFAGLEGLAVGDRVTLDDRTYRLESLDTHRKDDLPSQEIFGQDGAERLVIVTCGGSYSTTQGWDSNVVATFRPVTRGPAT